MEYTVKLEKPNKVSRKMTITVPSDQVDVVFGEQFAEVQKKAKIKGFRQGKVPLSVLKQHYGHDVEHKVVQSIVEQSYRDALQAKKIDAIGQPQIVPKGAIEEGQAFTFVATVEVYPEVQLKNYRGLSLKREAVKVSDKDVEQVVDSLLDRHAEIMPIEGDTSKIMAKKGDYIDIDFDGGIVTKDGVEKKEGMKGNRTLELGKGELIPGFEDELVGMTPGREKTFKITFPKDYHAADMGGKKAEFWVKLNEIKNKVVPKLDDEFAKTLQYQGVLDMRAKIRESIKQGREEESEAKLRSDLLSALINKNPFDCPKALILAQADMLAREFIENLKQNRFTDEMIQETLKKEAKNIEVRAEGQVRAGLILDEIAKKEKIEVKPTDIDAEMKKMATSMNMEESKVLDYYKTNPKQKENLEFRIREDLTVKYLYSQAKIK